MAVSLYNTATEYVASAITILRGTVADITNVGFYATTSLVTIPAVGDFTIVTLVDGTGGVVPPLGVRGEIDVLTLIGSGGDITTLTAGDYQVFILIQTASENIIRKIDTLTIL